jgi:hypothetical protein
MNRSTLGRTGPAVAASAALLAYAWISAGLRPFTWPVDEAVAAAIVAIGLTAGLRARRGRPPAGPGARPSGAGIVAWAGLISLLGLWELLAYRSTPRHAHPTLSSLADQVSRTHPERALVMLAWLLLGWLLFIRRSGSSG